MSTPTQEGPPHWFTGDPTPTELRAARVARLREMLKHPLNTRISDIVKLMVEHLLDHDHEATAPAEPPSDYEQIIARLDALDYRVSGVQQAVFQKEKDA